MATQSLKFRLEKKEIKEPVSLTNNLKYKKNEKGTEG